MKVRWDPCNKWLHIGDRWIIMLDNWSWSRPSTPKINEWALFRVVWDNGAFWAFDLDNSIVLDGYRVGHLNCFVEVTILGIGIRRCYRRKVRTRALTAGDMLQRMEEIAEAEKGKGGANPV